MKDPVAKREDLYGDSNGLVVTKADGVLGLAQERVLIVVLVARDGVTRLLRGRLLALRLKGRRDGVRRALELVTGLLSRGLLRVRLHSGRGLVGHRLASSVRHSDKDIRGCIKGLKSW